MKPRLSYSVARERNDLNIITGDLRSPLIDEGRIQAEWI